MYDTLCTPLQLYAPCALGFSLYFFAMYESFYNLKEKPFNLTPSPRFLYQSEGHKEALALLKYGVLERQGFILLTGDVGTGKTTMVRTLLDDLNSTVNYVLLNNPILSQKDFINYLAASTFKKNVHFGSKAHFLLIFEGYLKRVWKDQKNFNLIIDEAHTLSFQLLEEIRLLSNIETSDEKLINIFLIGQPELNKKLDDPRCRPLRQRISIRHHICPLNIDETREYMMTRLTVAGAKNGDEIFSKRALGTIYRISRGYPREINILADNALLLGYSKGVKKITASMAKACCEDLRLHGPSPQNDIKATDPPKTKKAFSFRFKRHFKWALIILFFMVIAAFTATRHGKDVISELTHFLPSIYKGGSDVFPQQVSSPPPVSGVWQALPSPLSADRFVDEPIGIEPRAELPSSSFSGESTGKSLGEGERAKSLYNQAIVIRKIDNQKTKYESKTKVLENRKSSSDLITEKEPEDRNIIPRKKSGIARSSPVQVEREAHWKTIFVDEGDTLIQLTQRVYGRSSKKTLAIIQKENPGIDDIDLIYVGQKIIFPPLPTADDATRYPYYNDHRNTKPKKLEGNLALERSVIN